MGKKKSASDGPNPADPWEFDAGAVSVADGDDSRAANDLDEILGTPGPVAETVWIDESIDASRFAVQSGGDSVACAEANAAMMHASQQVPECYAHDARSIAPGFPTAAATRAALQEQGTPFIAFSEKPKQNLNRETSRAFLYFDLETIPDYSRSQLFDLEPVPEVPPFVERQHCGAPVAILSNKIDDIKMELRLESGQQPVQLDSKFLDECERIENGQPKPRKGVLDLIATARSVSTDAVKANEERRKLLSTTPEYCMIAAMACASGSGEVAVWINSGVTSAENYEGPAVKFADEAELLDAWWSMAQQHKSLVGFNIVHFDLPVIFTRSILLGVKPRRMVDATPWKGDVIDLYTKRFPKGNTDKQRPGKLKSLAKVLGIEVPAGDCDGSQVEQLAKESPSKLAEYVASDIVVTRALHQMYRGYFC